MLGGLELNAAATKLAIKNTTEMIIIKNISILDLLLVALIQNIGCKQFVILSILADAIGKPAAKYLVLTE
ncbi:MAG: hypothetical protein DA330_02455 [Nitrososphaera sp.]|nr:hypothetical protein [Nitrososphaera sp.]